MKNVNVRRNVEDASSTFAKGINPLGEWASDQGNETEGHGGGGRMLCLAAHLGAEWPRGMWTTPNSNGPAASRVWRLGGVGGWGMAIKTDTWTASIVDLSYPLALSRLSRLDVLAVISLERFSADRGPGTGFGGLSREGGCESDDCDAFDRPLMSASPSTVMVRGPECGPVHMYVGGVGICGGLALFSFLT